MLISSLDTLLPSFRARYEQLLARLRALGLKPLTWETRRDPVRAKQLVTAGKSKSRGGLSMHCYDVAADTVCEDHKWQCAEHGCDFFHVLEREAEALGLVSGADWDGNPATPEESTDWPHVQGIPAKPGTMQQQMRALGLDDSSRDARDALCARYLNGRGSV